MAKKETKTAAELQAEADAFHRQGKELAAAGDEEGAALAFRKMRGAVAQASRAKRTEETREWFVQQQAGYSDAVRTEMELIVAQVRRWVAAKQILEPDFTGLSPSGAAAMAKMVIKREGTPLYVDYMRECLANGQTPSLDEYRHKRAEAREAAGTIIGDKLLKGSKEKQYTFLIALSAGKAGPTNWLAKELAKTPAGASDMEGK